jgi:hypothetical protein
LDIFKLPTFPATLSRSRVEQILYLIYRIKNINSYWFLYISFQKFNLYLQNPHDDGTKLTAQLKNIDGYLGEMETQFLCGTTLSYSDTVLLSRLQHIRVAGKVGSLNMSNN